MTPIEIKIELMRRRNSTNISKISRDLKVTPAAVHRVIERNSVSERIMMAVARAIELPPSMVFPEHQFKN